MWNKTILNLLLAAVATNWTIAPLQADRIPRIKLLGDRSSEAPRSIIVPDIEKLSLTEYRVEDPYVKEKITYKGVLLREFIAQFGDSRIQKITVQAIDDYVIVFEKSEWDRWDILLATQKNGKYMNIQEGGPARIVFPYHKSKDIDRTKYHPKWIWQINRIEFSKSP